MARRIAIWILAAALLLTAGGFGAYFFAARRDRDLFEEQLRLARAEGLPTNAAEFAAQIEPANPEENAAPIYRRMSKRVREARSANPKVLFAERPPTTSELAVATASLARFSDVLQELEAATDLPKCWFDRDWTLGPAVLMPELADMKAGARLLELRGSAAVAEGRVEDALRDAERILRIAAHAGGEPHLISHLVADAIHVIAMQSLARWSFASRSPVYTQALERAVESFPRPDVAKEWSGELFSVLSLIELCETKEGRDRLGLREEDIQPVDMILGLVTSKAKARIEIVRAHRAFWSALLSDAPDRKDRMDRADAALYRALLAFPVAARVHEALGTDGAVRERLESWEARRQLYVAARRALSQRIIPKSIRTDDLKSPFDGKPIRYEYSGVRLSISVSTDGRFNEAAFRLTLQSVRDD